jgi:putative iron-regulated protein
LRGDNRERVNCFPNVPTALAALICACAQPGPTAVAEPVDAPVDRLALERATVAAYAEHAHAVYSRSEAAARTLQGALEALARTPTEAELGRARLAWLAAREPYGETEVFRFYGGPVDDPHTGVETLLNAWPLDEAYIDAPGTGIIADVERYPRLDTTLLPLLNERGGEANVCTGWHAIEFLLWGADSNPDGPGDRPFTDFADNARRARYLVLCGELLVQHLALVRAAWAPDVDNYRAAFVAAPPRESLRKILAGLTILSAFEMSGERLAVAYETRDQEQEHSCFSDNTLADFDANQRGILGVWRGDGASGLRELARAVDAELAGELDVALEASLAAVRAIPPPFDRAIQGDDAAPGRRAVFAALLALERQSELFASLAHSFGFEIALHPGG